LVFAWVAANAREETQTRAKSSGQPSEEARVLPEKGGRGRQTLTWGEASILGAKVMVVVVD
jgi:hypothetical protein